MTDAEDKLALMKEIETSSKVNWRLLLLLRF